MSTEAEAATDDDTVGEACAAGAEWWARQVGSPTFRIVGDRPGERDFGSDFAELAMLSEAARHPVTQDQTQAFADLLKKAIAAELAADAVRSAKFAERNPDRPRQQPHASLFTDYAPDKILRDAAEAAGVSLTRFPVKTGMRVKADHVTASLGYGSPWLLVWSASDWERPPCGNWRMAGHDAHPDLEVCSLPRYHEEACGQWVTDPVRCARCGGQETAHYTASARPGDDGCRFQHHDS